MKPIKSGQSSLVNQRHSFEGLTQMIRWIVIAIVSATFWALPHDKVLILVILCLAIVYNLLRMTPLSRMPVLSSFIAIIVIDLIFATFAISITGGINSPYYLLLIAMVMSAAYWYGPKGLVAVGSYEALFTFFLIYNADIPPNEWPLSLISISLIILAAYYVLRLTNDDREERDELRQLNSAVLRERRQLESLVNSLNDGILAVDSNGVIGLINKSASDLFGSKEMVGQPFDDAVELFDIKGNRVKLFSSGPPKKEVLRSDITKHLENEALSLEIRLTPFKVSDEPQGTIIFVRDITKQKSLEEERDEFISLASHELRTPLALIEGNLSLAMSPNSGQLNSKQNELLQKTYRNVRHISSMVADLTTLEQADKGLIDVELERLDINNVIKDLIADYNEQAQQKGLELSYEVDPNVKPVVTSKFRLIEILANFVSNAIKYTQKGGSVVIKAKPDSKSDGIIVSVSDTGAGISATEKQKIFDKFYRSEDYHTRETEGTGLGLYIVKKLTARLNGEVWLSSELNKGTTFYLRVPQYSKYREDQPKVIAADVDSFIKGV